jgi:hypothetical protein
MPTDYHSVLVRAIAALDPNTEGARRALYDRARLTVMDAGLPPAETSSERAALEAAVDRIETEIGRARSRPASAPMPPSPGASRDFIGTQWLQPQRLIVLAACGAALLLALVGYAVWPRHSAPPDGSSRAGSPIAKVEATQSTEGVSDGNRSYVLRRQLVYYRTIHPVGTAVIAKSQHYLYLVRPNTAALRYTIGVGRECAKTAGLLLVSAKEEPTSQTASVSTRAADNSGTARSASPTLALGDTGHRIYGTAMPLKDGDDGCFALASEDIVDLYNRVEVGTRVVIN